MKKLFSLLLLVIILCSCGGVSIFKGEFKSYKNEVSQEEWFQKRKEYIDSLDILNDNYIRDLSSIVKVYDSKIAFNNGKKNIISEFEKVDNVSYDAESKVLAFVYNNDFSTRFCYAADYKGNYFFVKIVNLLMVEKKEIPENELFLAKKARESFKVNFNIPVEDSLNYSLFTDIDTRYYIDNETLTLTINNDDIENIYQYVFNKKYVCLNYNKKLSEINGNNKYEQTSKLASYILFEEVEIEPIL